MRIFEAIKFHFKKHLLTYGLISGVLAIAGAVFFPDVVRWFYQLVKHSFGWTLTLSIGYFVLLAAVAFPMINAVMWIFDKKF